MPYSSLLFTHCSTRSYPGSVLVKEFHGAKAKREKELARLRVAGIGTCITTYDTLRTNTELLNGCMGSMDGVVCIFLLYCFI
jgi:hypothetical protein